MIPRASGSLAAVRVGHYGYTLGFHAVYPLLKNDLHQGKHIVSAVWEKRELDQQDLKIILTLCIHMVPVLTEELFYPSFYPVATYRVSSMSFRIIEAKHLQALHEGGKRSSWIAAQMLTNLAPATGIDMKIWCLGVINLNGTCSCNTSIPPLAWTITMSCLVNTKKCCKRCMVVWWITCHKGTQEHGTRQRLYRIWKCQIIFWERKRTANNSSTRW